MTTPATQIGAGNPSLPIPCSHSDYLWLIRQVEADKWPLLYAGCWLSEASVLDILARYETAEADSANAHLSGGEAVRSK